MAARHFDAQYSWNARSEKAIARPRPEVVRDLAESACRLRHHRRGASTSLQPLDDHFVDDATFAAALAEFGEQGLVDTIGCLGNFSMLAMSLNTFQLDLHPIANRRSPTSWLRPRRPSFKGRGELMALADQDERTATSDEEGTVSTSSATRPRPLLLRRGDRACAPSAPAMR